MLASLIRFDLEIHAATQRAADRLYRDRDIPLGALRGVSLLGLIAGLLAMLFSLSTPMWAKALMVGTGAAMCAGMFGPTLRSNFGAEIRAQRDGTAFNFERTAAQRRVLTDASYAPVMIVICLMMLVNGVIPFILYAAGITCGLVHAYLLRANFVFLGDLGIKQRA